MSVDVAYTEADERAWAEWNALNGGSLTLEHRQGFDEGYQRGRESAEKTLEAVRAFCEAWDKTSRTAMYGGVLGEVLAIIESGGRDGE